MTTSEQRYGTVLRERLADVLAYRATWSERLAARTQLVGERPGLFTEARYASMVAAASAVTRCLLELPRRSFGDDLEAMARFVGEPALVSPWFVAQYATAARQTLARPDTVFDGERDWVIDQNVSSAIAGGPQTELMTSYFLGHPALRACGGSSRADSIYGRLAASADLRRPGAKLLVYDLPASARRGYDAMPESMAADLRAMGVDAEVVDDARLPAAMRASDRDRIVVLRVFVPAMMDRRTHRFRWFRALARRTRVRMVNSAWETFFFDKLLLARLSDPQTRGDLPDGDRTLLPRVLPWTRIVAPGRTRFHGRRVDVLSLVVRERHRFVLKKGNSYSSRHVRFGLVDDAATWRRAVGRACRAGGWVVQELVTGRWEPMPVLEGTTLVEARAVAVDSPFLVDGQPAGVLRRLVLAPSPPGEPSLSRRTGSSVGVVHASG
jgi:hypothetical protein